MAFPLLLAAYLSGVVIDRKTGESLSGITVAAAPYEGRFDSDMAGDAPPSDGDALTTVTRADGSYDLPLPVGYGKIAVDVYGAPFGFATYHGVFPPRVREIPVVQLVAPTPAEQHALDQINAFRNAPGGAVAYGVAQPLIFDQNLLLTARYWAAEESRAHRIGHTCAQLGNPAGCIEFNAYFHALPGALQGYYSGQNAAFDTDPSWDATDRLFEIEGGLCHYDWRACPSGADGSTLQTGHYVNLMAARRWIGLGEASDRYGMFFAENFL